MLTTAIKQPQSIFWSIPRTNTSNTFVSIRPHSQTQAQALTTTPLAKHSYIYLFPFKNCSSSINCFLVVLFNTFSLPTRILSRWQETHAPRQGDSFYGREWESSPRVRDSKEAHPLEATVSACQTKSFAREFETVKIKVLDIRVYIFFAHGNLNAIKEMGILPII